MGVNIRDLRIWAAIVVIIGMFLVPQFTGSYIQFVLGLTMAYGLAGIGLSIALGRAGVFGMAHSGFYAMGAYGSAILMAKLGWGFVPSALAAIGVTTAVGFVLGAPALRLAGFYLAFATLGFAVLVQQIAVQWRWLTGGSSGMVVKGAKILGTRLGSTEFYYLTVVVAVLATIFALNLLRSRIGRAWVALRDSEVAADAMGVNVSFYKMLAFAVSAAYVAAGGVIHAQLLGAIAPEQFSFGIIIVFLAMVVVGGADSIPGVFAGAAFFVMIPEMLQGLAFWQRLVFGLICMLFIGFVPGGLASIPGRLRRQWIKATSARLTPAAGETRALAND